MKWKEVRMTEAVIRRDDGAICTLTLNRPEKRNAINADILLGLGQAARAIAGNENIACVILRGAGPSFCGGVDLNGFTQGHPMTREQRMHALDALAELPQPLIMAVHGVCMTGGLELALMGDIIIADRSARFADTHARWGLVPGWGMSQRLPRRVGIGAATLMSYTGRVVEAEEARGLGLVDHLVEEGGLEAAAAELAAAIAANSTFTVRHMKRLFRETDGMSLADGLAHERSTHPGAAPDMAERVNRFTARK